MYVLDSSAIIEALEKGRKLEELLRVVGDQPLVTTSICAQEILVGAVSPSDRFTIEGLLTSMRILDHDIAAARIGALMEQQLTRRGTKINKADVFTAAICSANNAHLVTFDKDFAKIKDLKVTVL